MKMVAVKVLKDGKQKYGQPFLEESAANLWISEQKAAGSWGEPGSFTVEITDVTDLWNAREAEKSERRKASKDLRKFKASDVDPMDLAQLKELVKLILLGMK